MQVSICFEWYLKWIKCSKQYVCPVTTFVGMVHVRESGSVKMLSELSVVFSLYHRTGIYTYWSPRTFFPVSWLYFTEIHSPEPILGLRPVHKKFIQPSGTWYTAVQRFRSVICVSELPPDSLCLSVCLSLSHSDDCGCWLCVFARVLHVHAREMERERNRPRNYLWDHGISVWFRQLCRK